MAEPLPTTQMSTIGPDGKPVSPEITAQTGVDALAKTDEIPQPRLDKTHTISLAAIHEAMASQQGAPTIAEAANENPNAFSLSIPHLNHKQLFKKFKFPITPEVKSAKKRTASYLIIDAATISDPSSQKRIRKEISIIANSRDFIVTQDNKGNLIIFSLSERGGVEKLFDIEKSTRAEVPSSKILIGDCTLYNEERGLTLLDSSLDPEAAQILTSEETCFTLVSDRLSTKIANPDSRIGSNTKLQTRNHPDSKFRILVEALSRVSEELGGPDKMIGYEEELAALIKWATDDTTNIISLEAAGGMGKSRLRTELLRKLPNSILCSMNPSDKNIQGSSLATIAKQLAAISKIEATDNPGQNDQEEIVIYKALLGVDPNTGEFNYEDRGITLSQFTNAPHAERVRFAAVHPDTVKELCLSTIQKLRSTKNPKTLFVIEDLHHADRISEPHIIELIKEFSAINGDSQGKVLVTSRPEEMFQSLAFKDLKGNPANKKNIKTLKLNGLDLLRNSSLAKEFAFHSLPTEIRVDDKGQDLKMGDWYYALARKAKNSPWIMKSYMDQICEYDEATGTYPNIILKEGTLEVSSEVIDKITKINPEDERDIANYFQERLAALSEVSLKFLQYISLMEEKLGTWDGIQILNKLMGLDNSQLIAQSETLSRAGYLTHDSVRGEYCKLQHEGTRDIVLASIDPKAKVEMAKQLFELFRDNDGITPKVKYNLATIIAKTIQADPYPNLETEDFWIKYHELSKGLLQEADLQHDVKRIIEIAQEGLSIPNIQGCLAALKSNRLPYGTEIIEATLDYIFRIAENSRLTGQFDQTDRSLTTLQEIHKNFPLQVDVVRMYRISFDTACMKYDVPAIKAAHKALIECGKPIPTTQRAIVDILLAHFEDRFDDVDKIYDKNKIAIEKEANEYTKSHGIPSPQHLELRRICEAKNPYERIRRKNEIDGQAYDDDVIMHPGSLSAEDLIQMTHIDQILEKIETTRRAHPLGIDSHSELKIIEQQAGVKAFLGSHEESVKLFAEAWRIANQMGLNEPAARIAKLKGDTQVMQALLLSDFSRDQKVELLREAISTYSNEGLDKSLSEKDSEGSQYQFIMRLQRMRATGILLQELHSQRRPTHKAEIEQLINSGLKDFTYMNTEQKGLSSDLEGMIHFYFMGYIGHLLQIASFNGIDIDPSIYDGTQNPYMKLTAIEKAIKYGESTTDLGFGEVQRKLDGLHTLAKALRRKKNKEFNQARDTRDDNLILKRNIQIRPREAIVYENVGLGDPEEKRIVEKPTFEEGFAQKVQALKSLGQSASKAPDLPRLLNEESRTILQDMIKAAVEIFKEINTTQPQFSNTPEVLYQVMSAMGYVLKCAFDLKLEIDENLFDTAKFPYMNMAKIKETYEDFAQSMSDGGRGTVEHKSEGLFTILSILQEKEFIKKKEARIKKDNATVAKRRSAQIN
ncbi:MAG: hypothetical protein NTZ25_04205 [Candidatus Peregrinibacteria bacterium]|nr:hypothetical protein [Candidatus Peregrinibacteria bacterium]